MAYFYLGLLYLSQTLAYFYLGLLYLSQTLAYFYLGLLYLSQILAYFYLKLKYDLFLTLHLRCQLWHLQTVSDYIRGKS